MPDATQNLKLKIIADTTQAAGKAGLGGLGVALASVTGALYAATKAYSKFIDPIVQYNKEIKNASDSTGMATEELSRFVQVGDDMGVTMESITKALEMGTKNGFAPSIGALADLADKGNAMSSSTERAAMYTKIFGRQWAELNPILELGGQRIRDLADGVADGLVATEAEIRATESLRISLDSLNDAWLTWRNNLALTVVPVMDLNIRSTLLANEWARMYEEMEGSKPTFLEYQNQWHLIEEAIRGAEGVTETGIILLGQQERAANDAAFAFAGVNEAILEGAWAAKKASDETKKLNEFLDYCAQMHVNPTIDMWITYHYSGASGMLGVAGGQFGEGTTQGVTPGDIVIGSFGKKYYRTGNPEHPYEPVSNAFGGPVSAGGSYLVGEHGAERFTPGVSGSVASANDPLVQEIRRMVKTLPVILRDAVQKA